MPVFDPRQWELIQEVQNKKNSIIPFSTTTERIRSQDNVMVNPITGTEVPPEDLQYAIDHMEEIYTSNMIKEDRWAFLWYH